MVTVRKKPSAPLSKWIEDNVRLPRGIASTPGAVTLHPYQKQIADALADPKIERVSVLKSARVGFTTLGVGAIAHFIARDPSPILVLMPTESDCRGLMVDDIEGLFAESPAIADALPMPHPGHSDRHTLLHRLFDGGSLKVVAAGAPRNLRRHSARVLLIDEVDACLDKGEGDVVSLATQRTLSWPNRKIIIGGTPLDVATSVITRLYADSDMRVWELPCPSCGAFAEIQWSAIEWPSGRPQDAAWRCPNCKELIEEKHKAKITAKGQWCVKNLNADGTHAGFKINSLSSMLPHATWGKLAAEYEKAKDDPALLRVFVNTALGLPYEADATGIDETAIAARAEPFDLENIPAEVLALTAGVDCADDRLEVVIAGWTRKNACLVFAHEVIFGDIADDFTWRQLDELLRAQYQHPNGGRLGIDACAIDGGDGGHLNHVLAFCRPRAGRRVMCIKGVGGFSRPPLLVSKSKMRGGGRLWVCGVDAIKNQIFGRLQRGNTIRFSKKLEPVFYEQLASERAVVRVVAGKPVRRWERIKGQKAEALDAVCYSWAARSALTLNASTFEMREHELKGRTPPPQVPNVIKSRWMEKQSRSWP